MALKVENIKFKELETKVDKNKGIFDDENEMMQKYLREIKNKMSEHSKNFNNVMELVDTNK